MTSSQPQKATGEDMRSFRERLREYLRLSKLEPALFDAVNAVVTLKRTAAEFENASTTYCKQCSLTPGRLSVLMALNAMPDKSMALSEIGDYLTVTRPNVTGLVDGLVEEGLVERVDHPEDRRVILARLTRAGREFLEWFVPQHFKNVRVLMSSLTREEQRQLVSILDKFRNYIRNHEVPTIQEPART